MYNITEDGNWEDGKNVIFQTSDIEEFAQRKGMDVEDLIRKIKESKLLLYKAQQQRRKPALDDKILTSWNAIMIKGLVVAYKATGNKEYLNDAIKTSEFVKRKAFQADGGLWRILKGKEVLSMHF